MYIRIKRRVAKNFEKVFYFYLCESKRIEGKVTNKQKYLLSAREQDLESGVYKEKYKTTLSYLENEEKQMLEKKVSEVFDCKRRLR